MSTAIQKREFTIERRRRPEPVAEQPAVGFTQEIVDEQGIPTLEILEAINGLRRELAALREDTAAPVAVAQPISAEQSATDDADVRIEIAQMIKSIGRAKAEIAAIKHPMAEDDRLEKASQQLGAIVTATEGATNDILRATEQIETLINEFSENHPDDGEAMSMAEEVGGQLIKVMEACSFQDLTGQRVTKVVRTVEFIEQRIQALIKIWGPEAFEGLPIAGVNDAEDALLQGPSLGGDGISQDDIDALFN